eukprot:c9840_g1_i1.p1 GENE.c9840_g1_i1~~c9840_g1_i1.p1  ORF type:complete len:353 (-),score=56.05 c9840_g1_i1:64-1122(-)
MNLLNYDIGKRKAWSHELAYVFGGITIPLLVLVFAFAASNLVQASRLKKRSHLVAVHFFVAVLVSSRILLVILGTDNPDTFIAHSAHIPDALMQFLDNLGDGALLASCLMELTMFIRVGWAATLQVKNLAQADKMMRLAYFSCILGITDEIISGFLITLEHRSLRIFIAVVIGLEIVAVFVVLAMLASTLLDIAKMISKRNLVAMNGAKWSPPLDARDVHEVSASRKPKQRRVWLGFQLPRNLYIGFMGLPKRARIAFLAVVTGLLLIATQCTEKFGELVFQFVGKQAFTGPELTHILYRIMEGFVGFAISHSSSTISKPMPPPKQSRSSKQTQTPEMPRGAGDATDLESGK